ncbi:MAG: hybrid sensor histidine kinase/response regulator, partial [Burkholderiales bacterium PBB5]
KNRFLATMSHEMRTPLHGMLGITRMLQRAPANAPPAERERQLVTLERAGEHLLALITDVLDFSRIESGQLRLATAPFDLAALVADVGELTQVSGRDKGLAVAVVGPLDGPCWVHGDAARLRQVLINLTGNAVKFTDQGTVTLSLARRADGLTVLQVSDTGPGIAPDDLGRVVEAFHQGDGGPMRRHGGTGLGLAIARELVRLMHGELDGANLPTGGACFSLRLPLPACAAPVQATPEPAHRLAGRVLLVEDNPVNAMVAEAMLARAGL